MVIIIRATILIIMKTMMTIYDDWWRWKSCRQWKYYDLPQSFLHWLPMILGFLCKYVLNQFCLEKNISLSIFEEFLFETLSCQTQWIGTVGLTLWLKLITTIMIMMAMRKCHWSEFSLTKLQIMMINRHCWCLILWLRTGIGLMPWRGIGTYKTPNWINRCGSYLLQLQPFLSITATAIPLIGFRDRLYFAKVANRRKRCLWFFLQKRKNNTS